MHLSSRYTVTLTVYVHDTEVLYNAAFAKYGVNDPLALEELQDEDGEVNVEACLQYLYDPGESVPGTEIDQVECEEC
ncbi:hypothetical protein U0F71_06740 [Burkholderia pseudomallei]|uniref:hypothetical protein n=1 Tax=Burkholderia pseudomallei TaxID=28450 RepID=UPI002AB43638|nr:hypothetical protein [Burkholderia pseudomallei]MDY7815411.1 hypothetical protein [Burkholderia pseudomallei]MDY7862028.1 hypothetical protein [Burkholderia pseudomallei]